MGRPRRHPRVGGPPRSCPDRTCWSPNRPRRCRSGRSAATSTSRTGRSSGPAASPSSADSCSAHLLDPQIAYLTGDQLIDTPFATRFAVHEQLPYDLKRLRRWLGDRAIGRLEIKKRGLDLDPAELRRKLKPSGPNAATVILTRTPTGAIAILAGRDGPEPGRLPRPGGAVDPADWGEPRERRISWHDPLVGAVNGARWPAATICRPCSTALLPPPPIAATLGFTLSRIDDGEAWFSCTPDESVYNPIGRVHGGLVCTLLDSALGCAVHTQLPAGVGYTSIEIKVNYLRGVAARSGELTAHGWVTKPGRRVAFVDGDVRDSAGVVVATATGSCLVIGG